MPSKAAVELDALAVDERTRARAVWLLAEIGKHSKRATDQLLDWEYVDGILVGHFWCDDSDNVAALFVGPPASMRLAGGEQVSFDGRTFAEAVSPGFLFGGR